MRGKGKADMAMTMNELQATDALFWKTSHITKNDDIAGQDIWLSCLLAVSRDEYLVPSSESPRNDILQLQLWKPLLAEQPPFGLGSFGQLLANYCLGQS